MSSYRTTPEDDRYYPSPIPSRAHQYQYENPTDMTYRQHPSRAPQPEPYYPLPPTGMRQRPPFPSSGYPMNAPQQQQQQQQQQGYGNYYTQNAMQPQQTYPHPSAVPHQPSNYSQPLNTNDYYPHTNIPDRPPPAYDDVYSPDEGSLERAESVSPEEIHKAEEFVDAETLGWIPSRKPGRQQYMTRLEKPVVIPRIGVSGRMKAPMPFLRAYSPVLVEHDINEKEFLDFIDNLGVAQAGSPVFTAVNAAGQIIGLVPSHWAAIAAAGLQIAAGVGSAAVSKIRTQRFLVKSNEKYFNPRGLKVSLKMDEDLVNSLFADPGSPQAREYGRRLLAPNDLQGGYQDLRQRKMAFLKPYTAPLTERVLPPRNQDNILDKLSARGIEKQTRKAEKKYAKQQRKAEKKQMKLERLRVRGGMVNDDRYNPRNRAHDGRYGSDDSSDSDSSDNEMDKLNRRTAQMNLNQRMGDTQYGERSKHQRKYEKELAKANRKADRANAKDEKTAQRMEYIVVENL